MSSSLVLYNRDLQLACANCRWCFIFTAAEQDYYGSRGLGKPTLCRRCRQNALVPKVVAAMPAPVTKRYTGVLMLGTGVFILGAIVALLGVFAGFLVAQHAGEPAQPVITETGIRVTATYLNLRAGPTTSAQILGVLEPGSELDVQGRVGDWFRVTYRGQGGYVHSGYLTLPNRLTNQENERELAR